MNSSCNLVSPHPDTTSLMLPDLSSCGDITACSTRAHMNVLTISCTSTQHWQPHVLAISFLTFLQNFKDKIFEVKQIFWLCGII